MQLSTNITLKIHLMMSICISLDGIYDTTICPIKFAIPNFQAPYLSTTSNLKVINQGHRVNTYQYCCH